MSSDHPIDAKSILEQVNRICASTEFRNKKLLCSFLSFIVSESLEGRGDLLKGYTIGVRVLGKNAHFDADHDSLVRIHAGRLRRLLRLYYLSEGKADDILIEIPKGGYRPEFSIMRDIPQHKETDNQTNSLISGQIVYEASILVLPFVNLTGDPEKAYFAYGLSEEISISLTRYEDLTVINCWRRPELESENTPRYYKDMGARFLIDGSVQLQGPEIYIHVKLIDNHSDKQVWADSYRRNLTLENLLDIEQDIAEEITTIIGSEMGIAMNILTHEGLQSAPANMTVLDAMLRFYYFHAHISEELMVDTFQCLQLALQADPSSPIIQAMLADMLGNAYALDYPNSEGSLERMSLFAEYAMQHAPNSQLVRIVYAYKCFLHGEKERFFEESDHCLQMHIHSPGRLAAVGFHRTLYGDWENGKAILDRAMNRLAGYPLYTHGAACVYHLHNRDWDSALHEAIQYDMPGLFWPYMLRAACLGQLGRIEEATRNIDQLNALKPDFAQKARSLISRFVKENECVTVILDGLRKAGMQVAH